MPFVQTGDVAQAQGGAKIQVKQYLNEEGAKVSKQFEPNTILITIAANIGNTAILDFPAYAPDSLVGITPNPEKIEVKYLEYFLRTQQKHLEEIAPQNAQKNINLQTLEPLQIPVPTLDQQRAILAEIAQEEATINAAQARLDAIGARKTAVLAASL